MPYHRNRMSKKRYLFVWSLVCFFASSVLSIPETVYFAWWVMIEVNGDPWEIQVEYSKWKRQKKRPGQNYIPSVQFA
jgi:hypothetical protein